MLTHCGELCKLLGRYMNLTGFGNEISETQKVGN